MLDVCKEDDRSPRAANPILSKHLPVRYTPLVISRNKQLTIISQRKLALIARNACTFCNIKSLEHLKI